AERRGRTQPRAGRGHARRRTRDPAPCPRRLAPPPFWGGLNQTFWGTNLRRRNGAGPDLGFATGNRRRFDDDRGHGRATQARAQDPLPAPTPIAACARGRAATA